MLQMETMRNFNFQSWIPVLRPDVSAEVEKQFILFAQRSFRMDHSEEHRLHFKVIDWDGEPLTQSESYAVHNVLTNERGKLFCSRTAKNINVLCEFQGDEFTLTAVIARVPIVRIAPWTFL